MGKKELKMQRSDNERLNVWVESVQCRRALEVRYVEDTPCRLSRLLDVICGVVA